MDVTIAQAQPLQGRLTVPPDKAMCHRAVLLAAVARGVTTIQPWPEADDCQRSLALIQGLGVTVRRQQDAVEIVGRSAEGLGAPAHDLACGESGTTLRLAAGLLAGQPFTSRLTAGPGLSQRPMRRIVEPLSRMGARLEAQGASTGTGELYPPLTIHGRRLLTAIRYDSPVASAQVKSAVLLAGLFASGTTTVAEPAVSRDHTERMLRAFGARVRVDERSVSLESGDLSSPGTLTLPGDVSSAAFFLVAAACVPGSRLTVEGVGLNPTRTALLDALRRMGAEVRVSVEQNGWEPRGRVMVEARPLRGITVEPHETPALIDELPILMVAAACASGVSRLRGVGELRVKETDRIRSMVDGLQRLGVRVRAIDPGDVEIEGGALTGAVVESAGDHRTAMSLAVAALCARGGSVIRGAECVTKSFPDFFDRLGGLTGFSTGKAGKTVDKP